MLLHSVDHVAPSIDAPNADPSRGTKYDFPRDMVGYGRHSFNPQWPNGAKIAVSFVINYEEGGERSLINGDSQTENVLWEQAHVPVRVDSRDPKVESDYEYGSRVGVWRLLNMFEKHSIKVTVNAVGQALEKNEQVAKAFVEGGHEIASHGYRWIPYHNMSPEEEKGYISRQMQSLKTTTGVHPSGWFIGRCSPHTRALIHEVHEEFKAPLLYSSDAFCDDVPYWIDVPAEEDRPDPVGMLMVPYSYDANDLKFQISHGSWGSTTAFLDYLKDTFDTLYTEGTEGTPKMMTIGLHCRISGKPGRFNVVERFVKYILEKEDTWITTRREISLHWRQMFPYQRHRGQKQVGNKGEVDRGVTHTDVQTNGYREPHLTTKADGQIQVEELILAH